MRKPIIILSTLSILALGLSAKVMRRSLSIYQNNVPETETLALETMEFVYDYKCCVDTTGVMDENYEGDQMLLQIAADGMSKFSSYKNLTVDSLIVTLSPEQIGEAAMNGKLSNGDFMTIVKNYPDGKITCADKICMDWFRYEEEMPQLKWELTDSTATILGYECQSATCDFRGRKWTAFYTEDIPVMDGPWKLSGLPGLIMKASDEGDQYIFECIGIKSVGRRPITMYKVPYNVTDRKKYYDTKHRYEINPYAYFEATGGGHVTVRDEAGNPALDAYDPIELSFDFIEKDWRK